MKSFALFVILGPYLCARDGGSNGTEIGGTAIEALTRRRNGFFRVEKPRSQVVVNAGERKSDVSVEMTPEAVITGCVVDEYGDPARVYGQCRCRLKPAQEGRFA
jgi:hypothetical protein